MELFLVNLSELFPWLPCIGVLSYRNISTDVSGGWAGEEVASV